VSEMPASRSKHSVFIIAITVGLLSRFEVVDCVAKMQTAVAGSKLTYLDRDLTPGEACA
jgi:hypothetical protein